MNNIVSRQVKGNGSSSIVSGRSLAHQKLTPEERVGLAADVAIGRRPFLPSLGQLADACKVTVAQLRGELKLRESRANAAQAVVETTNGAAVEITDDTSAEFSIFTAMSDTPEVRVSLRRFAASLGCEIGLLDREPEVGFDFGPYVLLHSCGHCVWEGGLPVEGIAEALVCFAHERRLPEDRMGEAWADFGKTWK